MFLEACENTDNGLKDELGDGCGLYYGSKDNCGFFDGDEGFVANKMCCACGGGKTPGKF